MDIASDTIKQKNKYQRQVPRGFQLQKVPEAPRSRPQQMAACAVKPQALTYSISRANPWWKKRPKGRKTPFSLLGFLLLWIGLSGETLLFSDRLYKKQVPTSRELSFSLVMFYSGGPRIEARRGNIGGGFFWNNGEGVWAVRLESGRDVGVGVNWE